MTGGAFAAIGPLRELAGVFVLVAVHALSEGKRLLEVAIRVAEQAIYGLMLAQQRVLGLGMIEVGSQGRTRDLLPAAGVVARLASLRGEAALVRISVTVRAFAEGQACITGLAFGIVGVALLALHGLMHPGQRVARFGVIEFTGDILPVVVVMTLQAIRTKPAFVLILVASHARGRDTKEGSAQIFDPDLAAVGGGNLLRQMALVAGETSMLAFKQVPGFFVVERLWVPLDKWKVAAIMLGMATRALLV